MTNFDVKFESNSLDQEVAFGEVHKVSDGGYERGYAKGYGDGETAAKAEAEAHNEEILTDCNAVLPTKGVETADTLEQLPQRIGEIQTYSDGYNVGLEDGKKSEYDRFWDSYLTNLHSTNCLFAGYCWNDENFRPNRDIEVNDAYMLFRYSRITDIGKILKEQGVTITITNNNLPYSFQGAWTETVGNVVFATPVSNMASTFSGMPYLKTIESTIPVLDVNLADTFTATSYLEEIRFSGTIAQNANFATCRALSIDSVDSIIGALKDLTGATAQTLTLHATVGNKLTETQKATITAKNWTLVY